MKATYLKYVCAILGMAASASISTQAQTNIFIGTEPMHYPRFDHSATLLTNGLVLVAGGFVDIDVSSTAELYNPVTRTWTSTGSMQGVHAAHSATLLKNGLVLVAGDEGDASVPSTRTELYNAAAGTWSSATPMNIPRFRQTATLLTNGLVLVTGGITNSSGVFTASAELYDPATGNWTLTNPMTVRRAYHTATLLPNGLVLVAGGLTNYLVGKATSSAELYNPSTGTWTPTGSMNSPHSVANAVLLTNGVVLVAGGTSNNAAGAIAISETYNPGIGTWSTTSSLNTPRLNFNAVPLTNGLVLALGGVTNFSSNPLSSAELYDPVTGAWNPTADLLTPLYMNTATPVNGQILIAGGNTNTALWFGYCTNTELCVFTSKPIMNINFASADTNKVGFAAVGQTTSDFWNGFQFPSVTSAAVANLKWSDSSSSSVGIEVDNAPGQWGNPVSDGMYDSYIYPWDGNNITITLTNLPAGTYDFYLYGHGNADDQNGIFNLVSDSIDYGIKATTTVGSDSWTNTVWQEGLQYEVMRGVAVAGNQPVTINVLPANAAYGLIAIINGMQIVPVGSVPDPLTSFTNLMNINFAATDSDKVGFAVIGQTTSDFWNGYQFPTSYSAAVSNLKWADSSSSTVGVTVDNAPGQWGNPVSDGMFDSYIYPWNGGNITVTLTNLPTGTYDFYVYGHGNADDQNGICNLVSNSIDYGTQAATVVGSDSWTTTNWTDGQQYVLFAGVPVVSGQPVILNVLPGTTTLAMINGLQIAKRP